jgi:hypothetical protein
MILEERHRQQIRAAIVSGSVSGIKFGIVLGVLACLAFGVFRIHEGTFLCEYLLCLE